MNHWVRHIASILLLAIYLPTVILSSLHVHYETVDVHDGCRQCVGHFETVHHHEHDCLYCHFLGLDYLGEAKEVEVPLADTECYVQPAPAERVAMSHCGLSHLRAPPEGINY